MEGKRFRIYTRAGDGGSSCLYTGQKLAKDSAFFQAMGDVDELNSCLGIAREFTQPLDGGLAEQLATIQSRLIDVGSALATPANTSNTKRVMHTRFGEQHTATLESWIDIMDESLPPLKYFILPSGGQAAVFLHQARSVCRRAERAVVALARAAGTGGARPAGASEAQTTGVVSTDSKAEAHTNGNGATGGVAGQAGDGAGALGGAVGEGGGGAGAQDVCGEGDQGGWNDGDVVDVDARVYLNRLSDYLFTAARFMAHKEGRAEQTYQKATS